MIHIIESTGIRLVYDQTTWWATIADLRDRCNRDRPCPELAWSNRCFEGDKRIIGLSRPVIQEISKISGVRKVLICPEGIRPLRPSNKMVMLAHVRPFLERNAVPLDVAEALEQSLHTATLESKPAPEPEPEPKPKPEPEPEPEPKPQQQKPENERTYEETVAVMKRAIAEAHAEWWAEWWDNKIAPFLDGVRRDLTEIKGEVDSLREDVQGRAFRKIADYAYANSNPGRSRNNGK